MEQNSVAVIAGEGRLYESLCREAPANVHVLGQVSERLKWALFERADIYCLPSSIPTEVFGLTILEAYVTATPVVVSDLAAFDAHVDAEQTGLRFKRGDATDLARQFDRLTQDPEMREEMAVAAQKKANNYRWPAIIENYEKLFESVVE